MSAENVELVRRWYASLPDLRDVDPADEDATFDRFFRDYLDEGYEFRLPADYPEGEPVFKGRDGFVRYAAMLRDAWSEWRFEPERFIDAGDRVVVFQRVVAKGRASGLPIELSSALVVTIADRRITSSRVYRDHSQALKAAGLEG
jgi:ketosteroid isomerase-like protein